MTFGNVSVPPPLVLAGGVVTDSLVLAAVDVVAVRLEAVEAPLLLDALVLPPPHAATPRPSAATHERGRGSHATERLRDRIAATSAHGRVLATSAAVSHARRAVAMP